VEIFIAYREVLIAYREVLVAFAESGKRSGAREDAR
jgi:hypothetical protein